jgi:hypothetical protein
MVHFALNETRLRTDTVRFTAGFTPEFRNLIALLPGSKLGRPLEVLKKLIDMNQGRGELGRSPPRLADASNCGELHEIFFPQAAVDRKEADSHPIAA